MTLPLYLAAHLVYGTLLGHILVRRMLSEGEVLGVPLVTTLLPVGLITAPLGAVLLRYAGGWFLHGALVGEGSIGYERFHLGLMIAVGVGAALCTVGGMFVALAALTRERPAVARAPLGVAAVIAGLALALDGADVVVVAGSGRWLVLHPAGLVSLGIVATLVATALYCRARLSAPLLPPTGGPQRATSMVISA